MFSFVNKLKETYRKSRLDITEIEDQNIKLDLIKLFLIMSAADGEIDNDEISHFVGYAQEKFFPEMATTKLTKLISNIAQELKNSGNLENEYVRICGLITDKLNNKQKSALLDEMIELMQSDGQIHPKEAKLLKLFRQNVKYKGILGLKPKVYENGTDACPQCMGKNTIVYETKEIDRWVKPKKVTETLASGKTKTKYVNTTYIKEALHHQCKDCLYKYKSYIEREK